MLKRQIAALIALAVLKTGCAAPQTPMWAAARWERPGAFRSPPTSPRQHSRCLGHHDRSDDAGIVHGREESAQRPGFSLRGERGKGPLWVQIEVGS